MRMYPMVASAALAGVMATGAMAGDFSKSGPGMQEPVISTPAAPPAPARFNWTGGYAGAGLGYGNMTFSGDNDYDDRSNAIGGLFAGYRQDLGNVVLGAEALLSPATFGSLNLPFDNGELEEGDVGFRTEGDEVKAGGALLFTAGVPISADARTLAYAGVGPS